MGVNTIRTWATGKNTKKLLDVAEKYNIKVMLGIWMRHGKPGMEADDSFNYLEDKKGNLLGARIAKDGQWRFPYQTAIPEKFQKAIIEFES